MRKAAIRRSWQLRIIFVFGIGVALDADFSRDSVEQVA